MGAPEWKTIKKTGERVLVELNEDGNYRRVRGPEAAQALPDNQDLGVVQGPIPKVPQRPSATASPPPAAPKSEPATPPAEGDVVAGGPAPPKCEKAARAKLAPSTGPEPGRSSEWQGWWADELRARRPR